MLQTEVSELWFRVCLFLEARGHRNVGQLPEGEIVSERFTGEAGDYLVQLNPHDAKTAGLNPFDVRVTVNGWPAGSFGPGGGVFAAGAVVNGEQFLADLARAEQSAQEAE